ncbi:MAG TPA: hypothetical protein VHA33_29330 [Candidatus Angelobacter sp.]|jgi:hypothetical protein|nr:hypothetical protein [Candidatus Angelobacter sp.]
MDEVTKRQLLNMVNAVALERCIISATGSLAHLKDLPANPGARGNKRPTRQG